MNERNDNLENTADIPVEEIEKLEKEIHEETKNQIVFPDEPAEITDNYKDWALEEVEKTPEPKKISNSSKKPFASLILAIMTVLFNFFITYALFGTTRFAAASKEIFLKINIVALIALLLIDLIVIVVIRTKKTAAVTISMVVLALLTGVGGYAFYAMGKVNTNVNKVTAKKSDNAVAASLVIYSASGSDPITQVTDLEGKKVGVSQGAKTAETAEKRLASEGVNVEFVEFAGYDDIVRALVAGEVDCAVLPTTWQSTYEEDEVFRAYVESMTSILDFKETVTSHSVEGVDKDITKEPFTVLLTGENEGLADTIMVLGVNPISMQVTMVSIPRDSFVPISCYNNVSSKINGAHASSEACMVNTVENVMGVDIDYTIEFNFASVIQVVDAVGGIDVDIPVGFFAQCWDIETDSLVVEYLYPGDNIHLNGQQALGFARERYAFADGDFARQRHQQEVIRQVVDKLMKSRDPQMFLDVLDAAGANIKTNFTVDQMTTFVNYALQKAKRYYNQDNLSGVINFVTSRVYGYSGNIWDDSLDMYLYIYRLFNGSIRDNLAAIQRTTNLSSAYTAPQPVVWNAANTYVPSPISAEYYNEPMETTTGGPSEEEGETEENPTDSNTENPQPQETPAVEPQPEQPAEEPAVVEPQPEQEPVVEEQPAAEPAE